jgi:hypothetical protein
MRIIAYEPGYNEKHCRVLRALAAGIPGCEVRPLGQYEPCDIAIIFGAYKRAYAKTLPKLDILQRHHGRQLLMVESAFVKRGEYYQVGWGGYAGNADFNTPIRMPSDRWDRLAVPVSPWRRRSTGPIVVCGQLPWDTQVQDVDHRGWCREMITRLHRAGHDAIFAPHPRMRDLDAYGVARKYYRPGQTLAALLKSARAVVTWNSTSAVDAILRGVPAITSHPSSISRAVSQHTVADVERLEYPDRSAWLARLGYAQWTLDEMASGETWDHLNREYV